MIVYLRQVFRKSIHSVFYITIRTICLLDGSITHTKQSVLRQIVMYHVRLGPFQIHFRWELELIDDTSVYHLEYKKETIRIVV